MLTRMHPYDRIAPSDAETLFRAVANSGLLTDDAKSFLVHDLDRMRLRLRHLQEVFPNNTQHTLAIKSNPLVRVLRCAVGCGFGLEAAGIEEVHLALAAGCPPDRIVFDSPAKTLNELAFALREGISINVDNFVELARIERLREGIRSSDSAIGLRINPEVGKGNIAITSVGNLGSKFGVPIDRCRSEILDAFTRNAWLTGLHVHAGSQGCGLDLLAEAVCRIETLRHDIQTRTGRKLQRVNIGGGLPTVYTKDDEAYPPEDYVDKLREVAPSLFQFDGTILTEFGRAIQAGCGLAFSRVETVRPIGAADFPLAVQHLGADFLMRPVYHAQQWRHEYYVLDSTGQLKQGDEREHCLAGPLCFAGDLLAKSIQLPEVNEGDWIVVRDCGAYTLSMWSRHCNRAIPTVFGYSESDDDVSVLRAGETARDVVRFWS